ncbi:MAG: chromosomal replication initiator protein DnaA [Clostridia bacterium]|nr:chromosomal replication initiator protein DnaA [Clostridia bacterium]
MNFKEQELAEIHSFLIEALSKRHSSVVVKLWFTELKLSSLTKDEAIFIASTDMKKDIIEDKFSDDLSECLAQIVGYSPKIIIHSKEHGEIDLSIKPTPVITDDDSPEPQRRVNKSENSQYTFDNFVVGKSNNMAHAAAKAVANKDFSQPDLNNIYNPLFIYGPSGVGKTHLLYAITNRILERYPDKKIVLISSEEFTNQLVDAIGKKTTAQFRDKYRSVDVLLIDDIQFAAGRISVQEELFNTFNAIYEAKKQIILTSDRPPQEIQTLEDRLRTRFMSGLIADIQLPEFDLRFAILKQKSLQYNLDIPPSILRYIAENIKSSTRQLDGAIKKLGAIQLLEGVDITLERVASSLGEYIQAEPSDTKKMDEIILNISKRYGVSREDILSSKRTKEIVEPRHLIAYIAIKCTKLNKVQIGNAINRDRTTLVSSEKYIKEKMDKDNDFNLLVKEIIREING